MLDDKICAVCGKSFTPKKRTQQCCSSECANIKSHETAKKYYTCQHCGKPFWRPNAFRMKYCSSKCQSAAHALAHPKKEKRVSTVYKRICAWCGETFETTLPNKIYCCSECGYNGNLRLHRERWAEAYVPRTHICKECNTEFTTECGNKHSVFCCQSCADKYERRLEHQTDRHKASLRKTKQRREKQLREQYKGPVLYEALYRRDRGICQICGMAVHPDKFCDDSWGGTIDHIVPLSVGGKHSMSNCQLSHRICNSLKGVCDDEFIIDWAEKSTENNYWRTKYNSYIELMRQ